MDNLPIIVGSSSLSRRCSSILLFLRKKAEPRRNRRTKPGDRQKAEGLASKPKAGEPKGEAAKADKEPAPARASKRPPPPESLPATDVVPADSVLRLRSSSRPTERDAAGRLEEGRRRACEKPSRRRAAG